MSLQTVVVLRVGKREKEDPKRRERYGRWDYVVTVLMPEQTGAENWRGCFDKQLFAADEAVWDKFRELPGVYEIDVAEFSTRIVSAKYVGAAFLKNAGVPASASKVS